MVNKILIFVIFINKIVRCFFVVNNFYRKKYNNRERKIV